MCLLMDIIKYHLKPLQSSYLASGAGIVKDIALLVEDTSLFEVETGLLQVKPDQSADSLVQSFLLGDDLFVEGEMSAKRDRNKRLKQDIKYTF